MSNTRNAGLFIATSPGYYGIYQRQIGGGGKTKNFLEGDLGIGAGKEKPASTLDVGGTLQVSSGKWQASVGAGTTFPAPATWTDRPFVCPQDGVMKGIKISRTGSSEPFTVNVELFCTNTP